MRHLIALCALAALCGVPAPASADQLTHIDGWDLYEQFPACQLSTAYEDTGETELKIYVEPRGASSVTISNRRWRFANSPEDQSIGVNFGLGTTTWYAVRMGGVGDPETDPQFVLPIKQDEVDVWLGLLSAAESVKFELQGVALAHLKLSGSDRAFDALKGCVISIKAKLSDDGQGAARP